MTVVLLFSVGCYTQVEDTIQNDVSSVERVALEPILVDPCPEEIIRSDYVYEVFPVPLTPITPSFPTTNGGVTGRVVAQYFVDTNGDVTKYCIKESSGHDALDDSAVEAIIKTKFKPAILGGNPIGMWLVIPIVFELDN